MCRAQVWARVRGPLLMAVEAPARVGQRPVRSSSGMLRTTWKPTNRGDRESTSMRRLAWKTSARQVRGCQPTYRIPRLCRCGGPRGWSTPRKYTRKRAVPDGTALFSAPSSTSRSTGGGLGNLGNPADLLEQRDESFWVAAAEQPLSGRDTAVPDFEVDVWQREPVEYVDGMQVDQCWREIAETRNDGVQRVA